MKIFIAVLKHIRRVLFHKYCVFLAGIKLKVNLHLLLVHDLSKLYPSEINGYARNFFIGRSEDEYCPRTIFAEVF